MTTPMTTLPPQSTIQCKHNPQSTICTQTGSGQWLYTRENDHIKCLLTRILVEKNGKKSTKFTAKVWYQDKPLTVSIDALTALTKTHELNVDAWLDTLLETHLKETTSSLSLLAPGFTEGFEEKTSRAYLYAKLQTQYNLPNPNESSVQRIFSFGKRYRKRVPAAQASFHAGILSGRRNGLNLKKLNGLSRDVQKAVESSKQFDTFISQIVQKVERDRLHSIAISCTAGRHRSVTCAELLKKYLYPQATIYHVELKRTG